MNIVVFGATGTVGGEVVRQAIDNPGIHKITAVVRKSLDIKNSKLQVVTHEDYMHYEALEGLFKNTDACFWCLGISQTQVNEQEYFTITHDYALKAGESIVRYNPGMTFVFVSGEGANQDGHASTLFGRVKGKTEQDLSQLPFKKLYVVRPAGIQPIHINKNTALVNKLVAPLYPLLRFIAPSLMITSVELAKAMLYIAEHGYGKTVIGNAELKKLTALPSKNT